MASNIILQKQDLSKHCHELKASIENQAEALHKEIDIIVQDLQAKVDEFDSNNISAKKNTPTKSIAQLIIFNELFPTCRRF